MTSIVLETRKISKDFPGVQALKNVNFELEKGEVHILLGENGAGKSTLVKILSGAFQPSEGEIFFFGNPVTIKSPKYAQDIGIGVIYQELILIPQLTAAENIFLGREFTTRFGIINKRQMISASKKILNELGIDISCDVPIRTFGIAQQQMIEIAKALSLNAKILIMDEPTSALSLTETEQLFRIIRKLKEKEVSIIYISHKLEELFEIGDRVTVLRDGLCIGTKKITETSKSELIKMMVNRELQLHYPKQKNKPGEEILRVENLSIKNSIQNINFTLHRGEILGVSGIIGSGRTELAHAIFGYNKIDSGRIYVKRKLRKIVSPKSAINSGIALLTEDRKSQGLVLVLSVKENISLANLNFFSKFGMLNLNLEKQTASNYISSLHIKTPNEKQKVLNLSGGNQQKVVLAKWLCTKADIFIFDEPTKGIDVGAKEEIYRLMNELTAKGASIIMISSELPEIIGMSDRILVMHQYKVTGEISAGEATQEKIMHYALGAA